MGIIIILTTVLPYICMALESQEPTPDFYWREYTGIIPIDAVPGGYDINNKTTYIGQGFVKDYGISVGMIYPEKSTMYVEMRGAKHIDSYIKILCSIQGGAFKWIPTTSQNFHLTMINKYPIRGGYEALQTQSYTLNIGRIAFQGEVVVGKIVTASPETPGKAPMYFVSKNKGHRVDSYEALVYDPTLTLKLDVRFNPVAAN